MNMSNPQKKGKGRRLAFRIASIAIVALLAIFLILQFALGSIIKSAASAAGPAVLGVPVEIASARVNLIGGRVHFSGVRVGAPEGFDADVFQLDDFLFDIDVGSLFGGADEPIEISDISIRQPIVSYELKGLNSNLQALLDKVGGGEETPEEPEPAKEDSEKTGRKVVVKHFLFEGGRVRVAVANGKGLPIPLPAIELEGIGEKSGGVTGIQAFAQILKSIVVGTVKAAAGAIADLGGAAVDAAGAVAGAAADAADAAAGAAADAASAAAGAAADAAGAVAGAAADAAGAAAGAAAKAIGSIFGK